MSKQEILPVEPLIQCEAGRAKTIQRQSLYSPRTPKWPPSDKGEYCTIRDLKCPCDQKNQFLFFFGFQNYGCFPLCLTIRSETSGTNQGKMERQFSSKVNFQQAFHLRFDRDFAYITVKSDSDNFCKWNRTDRSKRTTSRGGPKYSGRTEPKRTFPFDFSPKFPEILA